MERTTQYDEANTLITAGRNGPYYMVRPREGASVSNHYLLAVLNHPLSEAQSEQDQSVPGWLYSHGKQFIEDLPVPIPNDADRTRIEGLVGALIDTPSELAAARTPRERTVKEREANTARKEIENQMSVVFGLSDADMEIVRAVPVPT